jgi:xanthine dehydrogenase YagR molybdenum-binding subunit
MKASGTVAIGDPLPRVDGWAKVTGAAKYSVDVNAAAITYGALIMSTIPSGRIVRMNTAKAAQAPGVLAVITPANAIRLHAPERRISLLQHDAVYYQNQPIGIVLAETFEQAQYAASLVHPDYRPEPATLDFLAGFATSYTSSHAGEPGDQSWGDVDAGLAAAEIKIDAIFTTPIQHHNPMEPHATLAEWNGDHVTLHDATQAISGLQKKTSILFGIPKENVHVVSPFVGGGFGCKGQVWSHVMLAALAAKQVQRPVKLVLDRPQMFGPIGARPRTHQHMTLGATRDGKLKAIRHECHTNTSLIEDYLESAVFPTRVMYACRNVSTTSRIVPLSFGTPTYMRAPGVATGTYAVEVAMDELAYAVNVDPLELRYRNYAEADPQTGKAFTSKSGAVVTSTALPRVFLFEFQLEQLFQNLIGNALRYHGEKPPQIHVAAKMQDAVWLFSIEDNGIGIEPKFREQVFGIFKRLHTAAEYPGTGMGLAICQRIVERAGGRIWIESERGGGSTFYFTLPCSAPSGRAEPPDIFDRSDRGQPGGRRLGS